MSLSATNRSLDEMLPLLVRVQRDLDQNLDLNELAKQFGYSPFHFHRLFKEVVGETPRQYVQRLRLEKAAYKLQITAESVFDIALSVGFRNHETFSRAFRKQFGYTPSQYREEGRVAQTERLMRKRSSQSGECVLSEVRFETFRSMSLLAIRNVGDYQDLCRPFSEEDRLWNEIAAWAESNNIPYLSLAIGLFHDDPTVTPKEAQRCDACLPILRPVAGTQRIRCIEYGGGPHGVVEHAGPDSTLLEGFRYLADGIRRSAEHDFRDGPAVEIFRSPTINEESALDRTDLCFPVYRKATS